MKKLITLFLIAGLATSASFAQKGKAKGKIDISQIEVAMTTIDWNLNDIIRISNQYSANYSHLSLDHINPDLFILFNNCKRDFARGKANPIFGKMHGINEIAQVELEAYDQLEPNWDNLKVWGPTSATRKWGLYLTEIIELSQEIIDLK